MNNKNEMVIQATDFMSKLNLEFGKNGIMIKNYDELVKFSATIATSDLCPKAYQDKPNNCFVAIAMGHELGLKPLQALQCICVVNGNPSLYGDAVPGLVANSKLEEWFSIEDLGKIKEDGKFTENYGFKYTSKRKGNANPHSVSFTVADAGRAGLWDKAGTWKQYPSRMLMYRARTFCCRDLYPDVTKGLHTVEEMQEVERVPEYSVVDGDGTPTENLAALLTEQEPDKVNTTTGEVEDPVEEIDLVKKQSIFVEIMKLKDAIPMEDIQFYSIVSGVLKSKHQTLLDMTIEELELIHETFSDEKKIQEAIKNIGKGDDGNLSLNI